MRTKKPKPVCEHCGAKMVEYRHTFSEALAEGLHRLYKENKAVNISTLGLTRNQWDNFQKLRYWNLVKQTTNESGTRRGCSGVWEITPAGILFVKGDTKIFRHVFTYRGTTKRFEGDEISFDSIHSGYKTRPEYAQEAIPVGA